MLIKDSKHNKVFITTPFGCITIKDVHTNIVNETDNEIINNLFGTCRLLS